MLRAESLFAAVTVAALLVMATGGTALSSSETTSRAMSAAAATGGCGKTPTLASGTHSIQTSGKNRSYILSVPANYDNSHPYRLVFGLHWLGGTATDVATGQTVQRDVWAYYGLQRLSNNSTIFVAPQGFNNGWANAGGEDVIFVDDMIREIEAGLCVDTTQLFAVGFSYGAAMSYALACARPTVFRAVAVQSGGMLSGCGGGTQPIAYLGVHGIRDNVLGISGGRSLRDRFVGNNGCTAQNPPEPAQGSLTHRVTTYSGCSAGHPVVWAAFDEGHIAAPQDGAGGDSGSRTWVPGVVWSFFTQFQPGQTDTTPPSTPGTPAASNVTATSATLTWTASIDQGGSGLAGYNVYRVTGAGDPQLGQSTTSSITLTGLTPGTQYQVYVRARDGAGNLSGNSDSVAFTTAGTGGGACTAVPTVQSQWGAGYVIQPLTITNTSSSTINSWTVTFTLPAGHTLTGSWNATVTTSGQTVTAKSVSHNGPLAPGASTTGFGFQAGRPDGNTGLPSGYACTSP
ncbi:MAG TPA: cellulose binding domain-containing protein [Nonomuraea sp.]|nr:cellulose binding domain-containing protein [Nonomuraea sp.]